VADDLPEEAETLGCENIEAFVWIGGGGVGKPGVVFVAEGAGLVACSI